MLWSTRGLLQFIWLEAGSVAVVGEFREVGPSACFLFHACRARKGQVVTVLGKILEPQYLFRFQEVRDPSAFVEGSSHEALLAIISHFRHAFQYIFFCLMQQFLSRDAIQHICRCPPLDSFFNCAHIHYTII